MCWQLNSNTGVLCIPRAVIEAGRSRRYRCWNMGNMVETDARFKLKVHDVNDRPRSAPDWIVSIPRCVLRGKKVPAHLVGGPTVRLRWLATKPRNS